MLLGRRRTTARPEGAGGLLRGSLRRASPYAAFYRLLVTTNHDATLPALTLIAVPALLLVRTGCAGGSPVAAVRADGTMVWSMEY